MRSASSRRKKIPVRERKSRLGPGHRRAHNRQRHSSNYVLAEQTSALTQRNHCVGKEAGEPKSKTMLLRFRALGKLYRLVPPTQADAPSFAAGCPIQAPQLGLGGVVLSACDSSCRPGAHPTCQNDPARQNCALSDTDVLIAPRSSTTCAASHWIQDNWQHNARVERRNLRPKNAETGNRKASVFFQTAASDRAND